MSAFDHPVFLVGSERSGTTLLRLMLDHHPQIAFNGESEYIVAQIADDGSFPPIGRYREWLARDRIFQGSRLRIDERLDFVGLVGDFLEQKRRRDRKELVGATVHYQFRHLARIWPRARYVYLYRDGRDVADSVLRMGWAGNRYVAADWWLHAEEEWDALRATLDPARWIELRFEDLVLATRRELERLSAFLGVRYSERMLDYVKTSTYGAPDAALNYQWKSRMRKLDVQRLEHKIGERLTRRGYALSGYPRIAVGRLAGKYLYLQSRLNAFRFRLGRFGLALTLKETLSRRLGLDALHRRAVGRINEIVNSQLK